LAQEEARARAEAERAAREAERAELEAERPRPAPRPAPARPKKAPATKSAETRAERRHDHAVDHTGPKLTPSPKKEKPRAGSARKPGADKPTSPALILAIVTGVALVILLLAYWQKR